MRKLFTALALAASILAPQVDAQTISPGSVTTQPGGTVGQVQVNNGAGAFAGVAGGTSGWVLTSTGASTAPTFQASGGGGCTTACTYTDTQTITQGTALHSIIASTGFSSTGSDVTPAVTLAGTLNTSGAIDALKFSFTCTSCASANLLNLYGGASGITSRFKVDAAGNITVGGNISATAGTLTLGATSGMSFSGRGLLTSPASAAIQLGNADAASPTAQTLGTQNVIAGTTNTAGQNLTLQGSRGTGTGAGGDILFKVAPAGSTGSAQNATVTALTISNKGVPALPGFTVSTLPVTPPTGSMAYVTDATACTYGTTPTGGGSTFCKVAYTGAAWIGG